MTISGSETAAEKGTSAVARGAPEGDQAKRVARLELRLVVRQEHSLGADLRAGNVHEHGEMAPEPFACGAHIGRHRPPRHVVVVRAVDPGDVHPAPCEVGDEIGVGGGLAREGDHDAAAAMRRRRAEEDVRCLFEPQLAGKESRFRRRGSGALAAGHRCERAEGRIERRQDAALQPAERGEAAPHHLPLKRAEIVVTEGEIVGKVRHCRIVRAGPPPEARQKRRSGRDHGGSQRQHLVHEDDRSSWDEMGLSCAFIAQASFRARCVQGPSRQPHADPKPTTSPWAKLRLATIAREHNDPVTAIGLPGPASGAAW